MIESISQTGWINVAIIIREKNKKIAQSILPSYQIKDCMHPGFLRMSWEGKSTMRSVMSDVNKLLSAGVSIMDLTVMLHQ